MLEDYNKIIAHNLRVSAIISNLRSTIEDVKKTLIPPCDLCRFNWGFRCENCQANNFMEGSPIEK